MESKIKGNFGFGCMRLPMKGEEIDRAQMCDMIDAFMGAGFNYFDTAHVYLGGKSERALRDCLVARYPREDFVLTDKLTFWCIKSGEDIVPFFEMQLKETGVDYFDYYLYHAVSAERYMRLKEWDAFSRVQKLRDEGRIRHIGMSFHDSAEVLDMILTEQPHIEVVQLQINYLDYDDPDVQSRACYDVAVKHGKRVIVMEPVKGGALVDIPERARALFDELGGSPVSYALRYAASYPEVFMVLSGMGNRTMMAENIATMKNFAPLSARELAATDKARSIIREVRQIPCTACNYCAEVCPKSIPISATFRALNAQLTAKLTKSGARATLPEDGAKASDCIGCGKCESVCPQRIAIRDSLGKAAKTLKI